MLNVLLNLAAAIGLSGAVDTISLETANQRAQQAINTIRDCYGIVLPVNLYRDIELQFWQDSSNLKIEESKFIKIINQYSLRLIFGDNNVPEIIPLTRHLSDLPGVFYIKSMCQNDGWSCGHWSVSNAKAIEQILRQGSINFNLIGNIARLYKQETLTKFNCMYLEHENIEELARVFGLNQLTIDQILYDIHTESFGAISNIPNKLIVLDNSHLIDFEESENNLISLLQRIFWREYVTKNRAEALHFVCHINFPARHWVLISVVNLPHLQRPIMLLQDSAEFSSCYYRQYLQLLHKIFIFPGQ